MIFLKELCWVGMGHCPYPRYMYTEDHRSGILTVNHTGK